MAERFDKFTERARKVLELQPKNWYANRMLKSPKVRQAYEQFIALQNNGQWASWPKFDWREQGLDVGPVLHQGECNSCWAFTAMSVYQSSWNLEQLRLGVEVQKSQFPDLYRGLETLLHEAETDSSATADLFGATRAKVETWYDSTMDRATVWYKQRIQWWLFGIGFAVALIVNADSIRIADALWREPTLRQAVAEQARLAASAQPAAASNDLGAVINKLNADLTALNNT